MSASRWIIWTVALFSGCSNISNYSLDEFVDQDLRQLDDNARTRLRARLPVSLSERYAETVFGGQPWFLWRHEFPDGSRGFILFEGQPLWAIPGASSATVHFLTADGTVLRSSEMSTGWRIDLKGASLRNDEALKAKVIEIETVPSINGRDVRRQLVGVFGTRLGLLRIEDANGALCVNNYHNPNHTIGPDRPNRSAAEWEQALKSKNVAEVLEALTWIGGCHRLDPTPPPADVCLEDADSVRLVIDVRQRLGLQKAIRELTKSDQPWVREAAEAALKSLEN